jgi:organic radical activating enzyme
LGKQKEENMNLKVTNNFFDEDYVKFDFEWFSICDKKCSYCYNLTSNENRYNRTTKEIKQVLDNIMSIEQEKLVISLLGGEVLLSEGFNNIMEYIYSIKKPLHKFMLFTHNSHKHDIMKNKIEPIVKFGDSIKIMVSLHLEDLDYELYEKNLEYLYNKGFNITIVMFPDNNFFNNEEWFDYILNKFPDVKIEPLIFDEKFTSFVDTMKYTKNFTDMNKLQKKYKDRIELKYEVDDKILYANEAKYYLFKEYNYSFKGKFCRQKVFESLPNGDIIRSCDSNTAIGNIFDNNLNDIIKINELYCDLNKCEPNLCSIEVKDEK